MKGKSYNPFKMWGSWVGSIVAIIYFYISTKLYLFDIRDILIRIGFPLDIQTGGFITSTLLTLILGFLIGWGVHSLFRRFK